MYDGMLASLKCHRQTERETAILSCDSGTEQNASLDRRTDRPSQRRTAGAKWRASLNDEEHKIDHHHHHQKFIIIIITDWTLLAYLISVSSVCGCQQRLLVDTEHTDRHTYRHTYRGRRLERRQRHQTDRQWTITVRWAADKLSLTHGTDTQTHTQTHIQTHIQRT